MTLEKTFNPSEIEKKRYQEWEESGSFACDVTSDRPAYTIPMPPPNVTGSLHMGHALTMTLQDILTRYHRMNGKDALWQPGTDHAGIATQMVVERQMDAEGVSRYDIGREKFLERVWDWKKKSGDTITGQLRRLGSTPDWGRERFTMDEGLSKAVRKVFVQLYKEKLIYKDQRLVNWDPKLKTAVSDLEAIPKETKSHMWHFTYPIEGEEGRFITVATTRPETMLGDTAVAVHPDDERYKDLVGKNAILPIVNRPIKIVADEYADPEQGSGAVKITPAHDFNDFEVGKRHDLEMISILDKDAKINENAPEKYQGMDRYDARKAIVADMDELGFLKQVEDHIYQLPHSERTDVVLEPFLTVQWYCDAETLAKPAIKAIEEGTTKFVPQNWDKTYFEWMYNIQPWCISRQLWWGHRIPAWYGPDGTFFVEETEEAAQAAAKEHYGKDVTLEQDVDVLDTWFSSALWPFSTLGWPEDDAHLKKYYPADVLITGFDIIFFWVARMMMFGMHFMGEVPFKTIYIHALVRDEHGQKMSKSKGNVIDPLDTIEKFGTDALRFTLTSMAAQGRDIKLSESRVEGHRNFTTKLWNAARYCEMNECAPQADFDPASVTQMLNKWIIAELAATEKRIATALETYRFNEAAQAGYQFAWGTFCDWYLEFTKPLLYGDDEAIKSETRATMGWVLDQLMALLNPLMPFITEEIHAHLTGKDEKESWLLNAAWPQYDVSLLNEDAINDMDWVIRLITLIRSIRADMNVPASAQINLILKDLSAENQKRLDVNAEIIKRMARLEQITLSNDAAPKGSVQSVLDEAGVILPIADVIDIDQERARLQKAIAKIDSEIEKFDKKLNNEKFLAKAPDEVVAEQRSRKEEAETAKAKLSQALSQIDAA